MATYTGKNRFHGGKIHVTEEQLAEMKRLKIDKNFEFTEEQTAKKPALEVPTPALADADKPSSKERGK
jgi:hypothetical protein